MLSYRISGALLDSADKRFAELLPLHREGRECEAPKTATHRPFGACVVPIKLAGEVTKKNGAPPRTIDAGLTFRGSATYSGRRTGPSLQQDLARPSVARRVHALHRNEVSSPGAGSLPLRFGNWNVV